MSPVLRLFLDLVFLSAVICSLLLLAERGCSLGFKANLFSVFQISLIPETVLSINNLLYLFQFTGTEGILPSFSYKIEPFPKFLRLFILSFNIWTETLIYKFSVQICVANCDATSLLLITDRSITWLRLLGCMFPSIASSILTSYILRGTSFSSFSIAFL